MQAYAKSFSRIQSILKELRENCPWDKKQTIHTLRHLTIEETYELADSITEENWDGLKEELGDLLLHILFYARIAEESKHFDIGDVIEGVCNKLVFRHPHIYEFVKADDEETVKQNWEKLKLKEGKKSVLGGVPASLPAITKAVRLQEKAAQVGFEWSVTDEVKAKLQEELEELDEAIQIGKQDDIESEFGDVLFSMINLARFLRIDPDNALEKTNKKFKKRFELMESKLIASGKDLMSSSLAEMDEVWNEIKKDEP
ncbi:MAG: nucleoside triphosphate pyrophosphohydrolase [Chitinophagaceae bacterium]|jgi:MazG family protein|nr:nucleoside triphosphate pyrophosphohydrolase [Chitinophagaceae bacterium]